MAEQNERRREAITKADLKEALKESRDALLDVIRDGNKGTHARLDRINGRVDALQHLTGEHSAHIESLQDRFGAPIATVAPPQSEDSKPALTKGEFRLLLAAAGGVWALIEFVSHQLPAALDALRESLK